MVSITTPTLFEAAVILLASPIGQFTHELAHFAVARCYGLHPILHLGLRRKMTVSYDDPNSEHVAAAIGMAPAVTGLTAVLIYLLLYGWPRPSWILIGLGLGLLWHSMPSREDFEPVGKVLGTGELEEWQRDCWKGLLGMLVGTWVQVLPYDPSVLVYLVAMPISMGSLAMFLMGAHRGVIQNHQHPSTEAPSTFSQRGVPFLKERGEGE